MSAIWSISKALQIPLDKKLTKLDEVPYTIGYVIRKRQQIDNFNEIPKEKRPPEDMIWDSTSDDIEDWFDRVYKREGNNESQEIIITDIED